MVDLKTDDIVKGIDGEHWIIKSRVKTDTKITVPLLPVTLNILNRYSDISIPDRIVFPKISNQKINKNLKDLGAVAEIKQSLSTHLARHSAATTIWLE
jgi:integrase